MRERAYDAADPKHLGPTLDFIWDGDGHNTNAQLTVFRNFDNATVTTGDPKSELLGKILARNAGVSGARDLLNRCGKPPCDRPGASALERRAERALQPLTGMHGAWIALLPELVFLRVHTEHGTQQGTVYSLVHNRAHTNVAFMFDEEERLEPAEDTVTVARGYLGSYPNFVFDVPASQIETFTQALVAVQTAADLESLVQRWGVRRTGSNFWATIDWLHNDFRRQQSTEFGLFDLNRYKNL